MPTTTLTMSPTVPSPPFLPLKAATPAPLASPPTAKALPSSSTPPAPPQQGTAATLRPLYTRAVRAFLHRDIVLTHSLLASAFALLTPPLTCAPDSLTDHRRKWDVLRITLDVTVYTAPPADTACIPAALRSNALLSAAALLAALHTRSVRLFAPADRPAPNPAFLPTQVLVTLALSSAKIGCPAAGRGIIEEWLASRTPTASAEDGYEKVLEVYLLNILPALGEWAYARQFLGFETELPVESRGRLATSLSSLYEQHLASLARELPPPPATSSAPPTPKPTPASLTFTHRPPSPSTSAHTMSSVSVTPTPSRPSSPTPSSSSASSNSTHTAVPANPHPRASKHKSGRAGHSNGHAALSPLTPTPSSGTLTPTPRDAAPLRASSRAQPHRREGTGGSAHDPAAHRSETPTSWHVLTRAATTVPGSSSAPSLVESLRAVLSPYIRYAPLVLLCVVLPALAMLLRSLRRRPKSISRSAAAAAAAAAGAVVAGTGAGASAARTRAVEDVRRRLSGVQARRGLLGAVWDEAVRALWDTVAMGGRGLV